MNKIKEFWNKLTPTGKKRLVWSVLAVSFIILTAVAYFITRGGSSSGEYSVVKQEKVDIQDKKILEISEKANYQAIIEKQRILMEKLRNKEITEEEFNEEIAKLGGLPQSNTDTRSPQTKANEVAQQNKQILPQALTETPKTEVSKQEIPKIVQEKRSFTSTSIDDTPETPGTVFTTPPPPPLPTASLPPSNNASDQLPPTLTEQKKTQIEYLGDIGVVTSAARDKKEEEKDPKKKASIYLPSSFMEATLLSGLDAPTVESAKGNPMLALLRIKDLAILPNRVKANLKGCFAVAEGYGNLADERAHLRLVSISCIDKKGQSIIDQKVKGYVVDSDGKVGLRGKVVAKMGSMIARAFLAGFLGGFGNAVSASSTTNMISPIGTTSIVNTDQAVRAGLGAGIAQSAAELQRFYMELARQTMPVIEVGATRTVTLVISEGVSLELKNINLD